MYGAVIFGMLCIVCVARLQEDIVELEKVPNGENQNDHRAGIPSS